MASPETKRCYRSADHALRIEEEAVSAAPSRVVPMRTKTAILVHFEEYTDGE
jgi:hypothetical protein